MHRTSFSGPSAMRASFGLIAFGVIAMSACAKAKLGTGGEVGGGDTVSSTATAHTVSAGTHTTVTTGPGPTSSTDTSTSVSSGPGSTTSGPGSSSNVSSSVSSTVQSSNAVTTVASVGTGPAMCDNQNNCMACQGCAEQGACSQQTNTCLNDPECLQFQMCFSACGNPPDPNCELLCEFSFPNGAQEYSDLSTCVVCQECLNDCMGKAQGCP